MASTVAKEVMAIKYGNTTGHSIKKFLESPFAGKHPKLISKGTKTGPFSHKQHRQMVFGLFWGLKS
jgi:hypothetical protein